MSIHQHRVQWWLEGLGVVVILLVLWLVQRQEQRIAELPMSTANTLEASGEPIMPLPSSVPADPARVALGERLFHDVRLSTHNTIACATCHQLNHGGTDGLPRARTASGALHPRNTPTIFNTAFNVALNWDGAVRTLEAHAERALLSPLLMQTTWPELLGKLQAIPEYRTDFAALYSGPLSAAHVLDALATYERSLVTPNSRFDRYLQGDTEALNASERHGYALFKSYGCVACHQGVNVGGSMFQKFGVFHAAPSPEGTTQPVDLGRFLLTRVARDKEVFRVPSLRNVALTAPYFHDGRATTLEAAVEIMGQVQLGRALSHQDIQAIIQFLHTLTGTYQGRPLTPVITKG